MVANLMFRNGIPVLVTTVLGWAGLCWTGLLPWDYLYDHVWTTLLSAFIVGILTTFYLVFTHPPQTPSLATDLFLGRILTPRVVIARRLLDIKMYLYVIGAVHLELNILSAVAAHYYTLHAADPNPGVALAAAMLSWFVVEYMYCENVHLYTYDLFAERVGFKLAWGCLCFYPFFYALPVFAVVHLGPSDSPRASDSSLYYAAAAATFFVGWGLSRGANLQKYWFKLASAQRKSGGQKGGGGGGGDVVVTDGKQELYCGGLWGWARHVNYLGEILEAVGIAMATGHSPLSVWVPWLYPLYYVALLIPRERDDDARCSQKYGTLWEEYCRRVPWRIVPYVY